MHEGVKKKGKVDDVWMKRWSYPDRGASTYGLNSLALGFGVSEDWSLFFISPHSRKKSRLTLCQQGPQFSVFRTMFCSVSRLIVTPLFFIYSFLDFIVPQALIDTGCSHPLNVTVNIKESEMIQGRALPNTRIVTSLSYPPLLVSISYPAH